MKYNRNSLKMVMAKRPLSFRHAVHTKITSNAISLLQLNMTFYSKSKRFVPHCPEISHYGFSTTSLSLSDKYIESITERGM